jgi:hypothetical protein
MRRGQFSKKEIYKQKINNRTHFIPLPKNNILDFPAK